MRIDNRQKTGFGTKERISETNQAVVSHVKCAWKFQEAVQLIDLLLQKKEGEEPLVRSSHVETP